MGTHRVAIFVKKGVATYSDNFRVKHILKEIKKFIGNKAVNAKICRIEAYDSIMCAYFCIGLINFMLNSKRLEGFANLFPRNNLKIKDKIIIEI